jgi:hypothetical protein
MLPKETTIKGIWWLESNPEKRLQGEITYGPTCGAEVDVFGQFYDSFDDKKLREQFTLHGLSFKAKPITLFRCYMTHGQLFRPGGSSCTISSVWGVVGGHYRSPQGILFKRVVVRFTGLVTWTWRTGIAAASEEEPPRLSVKYQAPASVPLGSFSGFSLHLEFTGHVQPDYNSLHIDEDCVLVIEAEQMQPYEAFERYIQVFQRFLSLGMQRPVQAIEIIGNIDQPRETIQETPIYEDYLILRKVTVPDWTRDKLIPQHLLFSLHDLQESPAETFGRFVAREQKLRASMDLYFSTVYNDSHVPRVEFLTLAQSLEAYHRSVFGGRYMTDEVYQSGLREVLARAIPNDDPNITADFRASLKKKLTYLHEFSLRRRLKDIAKRHSTILSPLIGDPEDFASVVSELRNRLTHPGDSESEDEREWQKTWSLSEKMALLIEVCFMEELGFSEEHRRGIIAQQSQRARRVSTSTLV